MVIWWMSQRTRLKQLKIKPCVLQPSVGYFLPKDHDKIPESEQLVTAGCAAQLIVTAAHMLGIGAIWRTGNAIYSGEVSRMLELDENEQVVAMIYLGRPAEAFADLPSPPEVDPEDVFRRVFDSGKGRFSLYSATPSERCLSG